MRKSPKVQFTSEVNCIAMRGMVRMPAVRRMTYFIWLVVRGLSFVVVDSVEAVGADGIRPERVDKKALNFKVSRQKNSRFRV